ncbi:MAG: hypothetical protein HQL13_05290 [Candidatus Omnitrophica bacterium]|nr:hypothetical protein [Candidatus Omnitrophota bacterium]
MRFAIIFLVLTLAGCASTPSYNPMMVASQQEFLLNENGFKALQDGMSLDEVHKIMGQALTIGYQYQSPDYKPLTIPNPYKTDKIQGTDYVVEYYIASIRQPNGVINDNELLPIVFKNGKLYGRGWSLVNSLKPKSPGA